MEKNIRISAVVGIDPGINGGIVTWRPNQNIKAIQMPKDLTELRNYLEYLKTICSPIVFLEKLSVRPDDITTGSDGVNMGKLYRIQKMLANFEQLKATIAACDIPFVMVHPMKWQNELNLRAKTNRKKEEKNERKRRYNKMYIETEKAMQIENHDKITLEELAEMVKQMRHNQRRCQRNPTPEKLATLESWERKVDTVVAILTDTQMKLF